MSQSEERARGRGRSVPASFGRPTEPEQPKDEDFTIKGGEAFHLVLHVEAVPTAESMQQLYELVRDATSQGVRDGYAEAIAELAEAQAQPETPGGGDGGPSSG